MHVVMIGGSDAGISAALTGTDQPAAVRRSPLGTVVSPRTVAASARATIVQSMGV